jgi:hypothetical protein
MPKAARIALAEFQSELCEFEQNGPFTSTQVFELLNKWTKPNQLVKFARVIETVLPKFSPKELKWIGKCNRKDQNFNEYFGISFEELGRFTPAQIRVIMEEYAEAEELFTFNLVFAQRDLRDELSSLFQKASSRIIEPTTKNDVS